MSGINIDYYRRRSKDILEEEGAKGLFYRSLKFIRQKAVYELGGRTYHGSKRTDNEYRWREIKAELIDSDTNVIDMGCADGFFSNKLADNGLVTLGIDYNRTRLKGCKKRYGDEEGLSFMLYSLEPDNIEKLPETDVVLLLTVFHHWSQIYGFEPASKMLVETARKTEKIFFELPADLHGGRIPKNKIPSRGETEEETHILFVKSMLEKAEVEKVCRTEYSDSEREDIILKINCREYRS